MQRGNCVGIVCCSNGLPPETGAEIEQLCVVLHEIGLKPILSEYLYAKDGVSSAPAKVRADVLMAFYRDESIQAIFDIGGGDIANELLPYLNYDEIARSGKYFWGYSDLTVLLNAIHAQCGARSVLYQVRNLVRRNGPQQLKHFEESFLDGTDALFRIPCEMLQRERMEGQIIGGNIRCLLKLAGTRYWPDLTGKILLLEAYSGTQAQLTTYLAQLEQIGALDCVAGLLLGTFTQLEQSGGSAVEIVREHIDSKLPLAYTRWIGHGSDSHAVIIGANAVVNGHGVQFLDGRCSGDSVS